MGLFQKFKDVFKSKKEREIYEQSLMTIMTMKCKGV